jgi:hypothetical protein
LNKLQIPRFLKGIIDWLPKNSSTFFTIIGILFTIYFSVFYVPSYFKEQRESKIEAMNNSLINTIYDIIYNNKDIKYEDVKDLIRGKELKYNLKYIYSVDELLLQAREGLYENRLISFDEKQNYIYGISKIHIITDSLKPPETYSSKSVLAAKDNLWYAIISITVGILGSLIGILALFLDLRRKRNMENKIRKEERESEIEAAMTNSIEFHQYIDSILQQLRDEMKIEYEAELSSPNSKFIYDYCINYKGKKYWIECRYISLSAHIPIEVFRKFVILAKKENNPVLLVTNRDLPTFSMKKKHNAKYGYWTGNLVVMTADSAESIKQQFIEFLNLVHY